MRGRGSCVGTVLRSLEDGTHWQASVVPWQCFQSVNTPGSSLESHRTTYHCKLQSIRSLFQSLTLLLSVWFSHDKILTITFIYSPNTLFWLKRRNLFILGSRHSVFSAKASKAPDIIFEILLPLSMHYKLQIIRFVFCLF